jgi:hypothetical protein
MWDASGVSPGRFRRSFGRVRETALLIGGAVIGIALFVFVVVIDTQFVGSALERSESSALPAVVIGVAPHPDRRRSLPSDRAAQAQPACRSRAERPRAGDACSGRGALLRLVLRLRVGGAGI